MPDLNGKLTITFDSDWHCGTGQGRHGGFDRLVARDPDGLPYVPAKTLLGLWRDACEKVALGFDGGPVGAWNDLVAAVFGAQKGRADDPATASGLLTVRPARLPADWRAALCADGNEAAMLRKQLTVPRFGVKIDQTDGVAVDDTLRMIERARAGLVVTAPFGFPDAAERWAIELLLQAGAKLWHHTGSSRRRGAGRCRVELDGVTPLSDLLRDRKDDVGRLARGGVRVGRTRRLQLTRVTATASAWPRTATFTIETELPLICTRTVRGNVATSHDFIPGGTILPILAGALGDRAAGLIRNGHLVVTDATPVIGKTRTAPAPACLVSGDKGREWLKTEAVENGLLSREAGVKSVTGWAALDTDGWTLGTLELEERGFANITDATGRPDDTGFYTFETIPARTVLRAVIRASDSVNDDEWGGILKLNDTEQTLGRYRKGDFGLARVQVQNATGTAVREGSSCEKAVLWLRSDAYLLDEMGLPSPSAESVAAEFADRLGVRVSAAAQNNLVRVARRDSWTTSQTLPRDSRVCLAAGSVVVLDFEPPVDAVRLHQMTQSGIGALRTEGFGECEVLPSELPLKATVGAPARASNRSRVPAASGGEWAEFRQRAWQRTLTDLVRAAAANPELRTTLAGSNTTNAARGTLREAARQLRRDSQGVSRWLTATEATSKKVAWGSEALKLIRRIGTAGRDHESWRPVLASAVAKYSGTDLEIPSDLAGLSPAAIAAALIESCLAQQSRVDKQKASEEGAA